MRSTLDRLQAARRDQRGFTLIELLIVIIILGVLAAVVVFSVRGISNNSEEAACKTELRTIETAIEAFYAENDNYPGTIAGLVPGGFLRAEPEADGPTGLEGTDTINTTTGALTAPPTC